MFEVRSSLVVRCQAWQAQPLGRLQFVGRSGVRIILSGIPGRHGQIQKAWLGTRDGGEKYPTHRWKVWEGPQKTCFGEFYAAFLSVPLPEEMLNFPPEGRPWHNPALGRHLGRSTARRMRKIHRTRFPGETRRFKPELQVRYDRCDLSMIYLVDSK